MESDPTPGSNDKLCSLNQEKFRQNPRAYGWNVKGCMYFTPISGSGQSYRVEYEASIAPWGLTRDEQIERLHVDLPNELVEELLIPVREAARQAVCRDLEMAGLQADPF
jgi:hypothetical protein